MAPQTKHHTPPGIIEIACTRTRYTTQRGETPTSETSRPLLKRLQDLGVPRAKRAFCRAPSRAKAPTVYKTRLSQANLFLLFPLVTPEKFSANQTASNVFPITQQRMNPSLPTCMINQTIKKKEGVAIYSTPFGELHELEYTQSKLQ